MRGGKTRLLSPSCLSFHLRRLLHHLLPTFPSLPQGRVVSRGFVASLGYLGLAGEEEDKEGREEEGGGEEDLACDGDVG